MKDLILCFDCGDTLVDESTQTFAENGDVLPALPIPGVEESLRAFKAEGYRMALIADGRVASFQNILKGLDLWDLFDAHIISEAVGVEKPDARMFEAALRALGLTQSDAPRVLMFGNNIERDIVGANEMGMLSALLTYSPRYRMTPQSPAETPAYQTSTPRDWHRIVRCAERVRLTH